MKPVARMYTIAIAPLGRTLHLLDRPPLNFVVVRLWGESLSTGPVLPEDFR